jgi:hypothetical protein
MNPIKNLALAFWLGILILILAFLATYKHLHPD